MCHASAMVLRQQKNPCTLKEVKLPFYPYPCSCITYQYFSLLGDKRTTLICPRIRQSLDHTRSFGGGLAIGNEFLEAISLRDSITA